MFWPSREREHFLTSKIQFFYKKNINYVINTNCDFISKKKIFHLLKTYQLKYNLLKQTKQMYANGYNAQHMQMNSMNSMGGLGGMGMGGLGMLGNMGAANGMFFYSGNSIGLESKLEDARNHSPPTEATITVSGAQIKQHNIGCYLATIICASIIIIPVFFICCNWWKKIVNPAYAVPLSTYQKLQVLFSSPSIRSVNLIVVDSTFDQIKAKLLWDMLSRSVIKGFTFTNAASPNDFNSNQWSDFKNHMKPLKSLPIMTDIKWYNQLVL